MVRWIPTTNGLIQTRDISRIKICKEESENEPIYKVLAEKDGEIYILNECKTKEEAETFVYVKMIRLLNETDRY